MQGSSGSPRRVLVAFDKLKGALSAHEACDIVARVVRRRRPEWLVDTAPLADGGDGFCRILTEAARGHLRRARVSGSQLSEDGASALVDAEFGSVDAARIPRAAREHLGWGDSFGAGEASARVAILEMAAANGLALIAREQRDVWHASSRGTGELLSSAKELDVDAIVLGVGGSATSDLGLGALAALGLSFEDRAGHSLQPLPAHWPRLHAVRGTVDVALPRLTIACDVASPLLGASGAAAVYGPQKGLAAADVPGFDREAERIARLLCAHVGVDPSVMRAPGAGAAGGIAFGLSVAAGARIVPGFELIWRWLDLEPRVLGADLVMTGEGRFDRGSLAGKGPGELMVRASARGRSTCLFAGSVDPAAAAASLAGGELVQISPPELPLDHALARAAHYLEVAVERWLEANG